MKVNEHQYYFPNSLCPRTTQKKRQAIFIFKIIGSLKFMLLDCGRKPRENPCVYHQKTNKKPLNITVTLKIFKQTLNTSYLVDIIQLYDIIKQTVEVIEERYHLHCWADRTHGGKSHNVWEEDGHHVIALGLHRLPCHQLICNVSTTNQWCSAVTDRVDRIHSE